MHKASRTSHPRLLLLLLHTGSAASLSPLHISARQRHPGRHVCTPLMKAADDDFDVVVVGGGASGIFSAVAAARAGASVLCLEGGSQPLRKVRISGGGRCNVMHDASTWESHGGSGRDLLSERYPRGADQLLGSLTSRFSPVATAEWFEAEGVELKVEADGRVFPTTDDSATIIEALLGAARRAGVQLRKRAKVLPPQVPSEPPPPPPPLPKRRAAAALSQVRGVAHAPKADGACPGFEVRYAAAEAEEGEARVRCAALVLATGSESHALAADLGHEIARCLAAHLHHSPPAANGAHPTHPSVRTSGRSPLCHLLRLHPRQASSAPE